MRSSRVLGITDEESKDTLATREQIQKDHLQDRRKAFIDVRANDPGLFRRDEVTVIIRSSHYG